MSSHVFRKRVCLQCGVPDTGPDSWRAPCPTPRSAEETSKIEASEAPPIPGENITPGNLGRLLLGIFLVCGGLGSGLWLFHTFPQHGVVPPDKVVTLIVLVLLLGRVVFFGFDLIKQAMR